MTTRIRTVRDLREAIAIADDATELYIDTHGDRLDLTEITDIDITPGLITLRVDLPIGGDVE